MRILATSREALNIAGEVAWIVPSLQLPNPNLQSPASSLQEYDAIRLFVERASAIGSQLTQDAATARAVTNLCARLDGLPLALELAAARMSIFTPQELLERLDNRFLLLTDGASDLPVRQQTLLRAIDWSYQLLDQAKQRLLSRLAVFHGGFTLDAIEAMSREVGEPDGALVSDLAALVDSSLVLREDGPDGAIRFGLLESIREYALQKVHARGEWEVNRQRYAQY